MAQVAAVVVAAGQGLRAGGEIPKQFRRIAGETLLERALSAFAEASEVTFVQPVIRPDDVNLVRRLTRGMNVLEPVAGGATRQASVRAGLEALVACTPDIVLVHGSSTQPTVTRTTLISSTPHPMLAVSSRCFLIRCCLNRFSHCTHRTGCGRSDSWC